MADVVTSLAGAIQRFEGWSPGSVSYRNNNPGNLRSGPGMIGTDANGYAVFPDYQTGWNALLNQVQLNIDRGLTLNEFFAGKPGVYAGYAPAADANQPYGYAATVGGWIGVDPNVPLNQAGMPASGALVDLSGTAASVSTSDILSSLGLTNAFTQMGIDPTSPEGGLMIALGIGVLGFAVMGVLNR